MSAMATESVPSFPCCTAMGSWRMIALPNFINGLSGDTLELSNGTVYNVCRKFSELCATQTPAITNEILANDVLCTDATTMYIDGNQKNILQFQQ